MRDKIRNSKSIAFDMDQVITDTLDKQLEVMNKHFSMNVKKEDLYGKHIKDFLPTKEHLEELYNLVNTKGFFRDLKILETNTKEILKEINNLYNVYICTAAMEVPNSLEDKYLWLREELPFLNPDNFVFCGTKKIMNCDVLIDDTPLQLNRFNGIGVLFSTPLNLNNKEFFRVSNWNDIAEIFL